MLRAGIVFSLEVRPNMRSPGFRGRIWGREVDGRPDEVMLEGELKESLALPCTGDEYPGMISREVLFCQAKKNQV